MRQGLKETIKIHNKCCYYYIWAMGMRERWQEVVNIYRILLQASIFKGLLRMITKNQRQQLWFWWGQQWGSVQEVERRGGHGKEEGIREDLGQCPSLSQRAKVEMKMNMVWTKESGKTNLSEWWMGAGGQTAEVGNKIGWMEPQKVRNSQEIFLF